MIKHKKDEVLWLVLLIIILSGILVSSISTWLLPESNWVYFTKGWMRYICHTNETRSFVIEGAPMILCSRCTGIYFSLLIGLIVSFFISFPKKMRSSRMLVLGISVGIIVFDVLADTFGLWSNTLVSRFITGVVFGLTLSVYFFTFTSNGESSYGK